MAKIHKIGVRITDEEKRKLEGMATKCGAGNISLVIRELIRNSEVKQVAAFSFNSAVEMVQHAQA